MADLFDAPRGHRHHSSSLAFRDTQRESRVRSVQQWVGAAEEEEEANIGLFLASGMRRRQQKRPENS